MAQTAEQIRELIRDDTRELKRLADRTEAVLQRRDGRMRKARALGVSGVELAEDTGLDPSRVSQIAPKPKKTAAASPQPAAAREIPEAPAPLADDELPARYRPGVTGQLGPLLSDYVTDAWSKNQTELPTIFLDLASGHWASPGARSGRMEFRQHSASELLAQLPEGVQRVYLVGPRPMAGTPRPGEELEAMRLWFLEGAAGWDNAGHFFPDEGAPIGRWTRTRDGAPAPDGLTVTLAGDWFGQSDYSAHEAAQAWSVLRRRVKDTFGEGANLLTTPATTGRELWRRTIGKDRKGQRLEYPVLSTELRELIQSTSGQGRREVIPEGPQEIGGFFQYDMRFAYSALAWGLPVGAPELITGKQWEGAADSARERLIQGRGRWLVTATVPDGWEHVGILPAPGAGRWTYPRTPGQRFTSWVTGTELALAFAHGWPVTVHEGMHFREGRPLNLWRDRLTELYTEAETAEWAAGVSRLVRTALRNLVLMSVGAFASRTHKVTRHAPMTPEGERLLPDDAPIRIVGNHYEWQEEGTRSEWVKRMDHPEWSAEIWGRCRGRLLSAPTGPKGSPMAGALHVAPGMVLGMRTDALYLATDPGWADDGKPGRYRLESAMAGPLARPHDEAELSAMKERAAR